MLVCASLCAACTRDRGCSVHPVFPAPSDFRRAECLKQNSRGMCGEIAKVCLPSKNRMRKIVARYPIYEAENDARRFFCGEPHRLVKKSKWPQIIGVLGPLDVDRLTASPSVRGAARSRTGEFHSSANNRVECGVTQIGRVDGVDDLDALCVVYHCSVLSCIVGLAPGERTKGTSTPFP